ncbi:MAG: phosphatase PAP2 family protein [Prevotella sp.]
MKEKQLILAARIISMVFTPLYLSLVGMIVLFMFSYLSLLPPSYKLTVLGIVYLFTILLPTLLIHLYRRNQGWSPIDLGRKDRRMGPYIISILCYFACFYVMGIYHIPHFMASILMAALMIQIVCALINLMWKISTHSAAIGGVAGALLAFSAIFMFNPVWWFCMVLIVAGMVGSSRMILRQHTLPQVIGGFIAGLLVAYLVVLFL